MNQPKFIMMNVKTTNGEISRQFINMNRIVRIYENKNKEIILELSDYEELVLTDTNLDVLMDRFK
jgi:hypothetical protein